jgi:hypothetical protein
MRAKLDAAAGAADALALVGETLLLVSSVAIHALKAPPYAALER